MPITNVASVQLALLKTTASQGSNGVERRERSAMARTKNAIGTTTRFANNEIGVTRWKYHRINGSDPVHAARETLPARNSQSKLACIKRRGPRTSTRGKKGSATLQRSNDRQRGSDLPCIHDLQPGWSTSGFGPSQDGTSFLLNSDRSPGQPVTVRLTAACTAGGASPSPARAPGVLTYTRLDSIQPRFAGTL